MNFNRVWRYMYNGLMYLPEKFFLGKRRRRLLSGLKGHILEVGVGTGSNFRYYGTDVHITGIEPTPYMLAGAERRKAGIKNKERFSLYAVGCGDRQLDELVHPSSMDAVVCTLVLCTIPDAEAAIADFIRWLKPGGRLIVLEHIRAHGSCAGKCQDVIHPIWEQVAGGCQVNRATDQMLQVSGLKMIRERRFNMLLPFYEAEYEKRREVGDN